MESEKGKKLLAEVLVHEQEHFLRFVRRKLDELPRMDAEDVLSDVTCSLLNQADVVEQVENLTAYIYRSLANRIVDHHRRNVPSISLDSTEDDAGKSMPAAMHADRRLRPDQLLEQRELKTRLYTALGELTPRERAVWIATEIDGYTFRELAEEWESPIGTLLSLKSRASARLRTLLLDYRQNRSS